MPVRPQPIAVDHVTILVSDWSGAGGELPGPVRRGVSQHPLRQAGRTRGSRGRQDLHLRGNVTRRCHIRVE